MMNVRRATPDDATIVRDLRLAALAESPHAFGSTLEREQNRTTPEWQQWLSRGALFVLEDAGEPRGLAAGIPHDDDPLAIYLVSMWIHPAARGQGGGDRLVAAVVAWAETTGASRVVLDVNHDNDRAQRLYERSGFRPTGHEWRRERDGVLEIEMSRPIGALARSERSR